MSESKYIRGFWDIEFDTFNYAIETKEELREQSLDHESTIIILPLPSIILEGPITDQMDDIILSTIERADLDRPVYLYGPDNTDREELGVDILITDFTVELVSALENKDELVNFQSVLNDSISEGFDSMLDYTEYLQDHQVNNSPSNDDDEEFMESVWESAFEEPRVEVAIVESKETFFGLKLSNDLHTKTDSSGRTIVFNDEETISEIRKSLPEAMLIKRFSLPSTKTNEDIKDFLQSEINKLKTNMGIASQEKIIH